MKETFRHILYLAMAVVIFILMRIILFTCRKEVVRSNALKDFEATKKPAIYALWHGRIFPMLVLKPKGRKLHTVISRHGDGEVISNVLSFGGVSAIRGSTDRAKGENKISKKNIKLTRKKNRGGSFVIRESMRILKDVGDSIVITPDGPKGPRFKYKSNSIRIASETATPIVPVSFSSSNTHIFGSWDKFLLPLPFSRVKVQYGDPIFIPSLDSDEQTEKYGKEVEDALNNITTTLDQEFNVNLNG